MSKLPEQHQFVDLSDYGRPAARLIAGSLSKTSFTPIHVTLAFVFSGLIALYCILNDFLILAAIFLVIKSILDAADGELARIKKTPSYTGRYFDSIADIILNLLIMMAICKTTDASISNTIVAFIGLQLQGTLYNYYYVILRNKLGGDTTSRIIENNAPTAMKGEQQKNVQRLFFIYHLLYGYFDRIIYRLDKNAAKGKTFPNWFMTAISTLGLGFQLLLISLMLILGWKEYIISFFIGYTFLIVLFVGIRKIWLK
ncbi:CDP-alcohol phosphatidyltransferase family protein [Cyclobacteriaceae bacterium]|jgi:phosphatidylglycerophosphate synthase|nr:CDP-alcohol phosphatidyltransferase family protein [Cyclobacteriaceae bacterium]